MKPGLLSFVLALGVTVPTSVAVAKKPQFRVDSLQVELPGKFNSNYHRGRFSSSIKSKLLEMKRCFVDVVRKNPDYDGFLWLAVSFDKHGKVRNKNLTTTVKNPVAMKCMEWMVDFWNLPRGSVGKANAQVRIFAR